MLLSSWQSHCESSTGSYDKCRTVPNGTDPQTKPIDLAGPWVHLWLLQSTSTTASYYCYSAWKQIDTHFTIPYKLKVWVNVAGWLHAEMVYPPTDNDYSVLALPMLTVRHRTTILNETNALSPSQTNTPVFINKHMNVQHIQVQIHTINVNLVSKKLPNQYVTSS